MKLNSLPMETLGKDVVVVWKPLDSFEKNSDVFYTDSNEAAMIERIFNVRESWNYNDTSSNVTANFYPVDSAIAVKSDLYKFTVMNDRA